MEFVHNVIEALSTCCLSCREEEARPGEATERSPLLLQQDQRNQTPGPIRRISEHNIEQENDISSSFPTREKDEQTALNRIVQETNSNIIDVSALDAHHMLEQSEYNDRVRIYNQRLAQQWTTIPPEVHYNGLLKDVPNPEQLLFFNPTSEEMAIAKNFIREAAQAINSMKIEKGGEDLVVPFHFK